ncbi:7405_t:CDS:2, partial [Funneliformis geosporum]
PIHDQAYFRNKILKLYPGISYRRSNDRSEDVYNCKTKSSSCCMFRYTGDRAGSVMA